MWIDLATSFTASSIRKCNFGEGLKEQAGHMQVEIARLIGVDKSTVSRELARNKGQRGCRPKQAHQLALERRQEKVKSSITADEWLRIEALLRMEWSPEEIGEPLRMEGRP